MSHRQPAEKLPRKWWVTPGGKMIPLEQDETHEQWSYNYVVGHHLEKQAERGGPVTFLRDLGWIILYRNDFTLISEYEVKRGINDKQLRTLVNYAIMAGLDLKDGIKNRLIPLTENSSIKKTEKYLYNMNYRDFYKNKKRPVSEEVEENPLQGLNLDDPSVDDGLPKRADGSLDVTHDGRPIHLSKIVQIGAEFGKSANGAVSGYSNVGVDEKSKGASQSKDGQGVSVEHGSENVTAGGKGVSPEEAARTVGGETVEGGGQKQGGPNTVGSIAGTPKAGGGISDGDSVLSLQEAKSKLRNMVKEALKEISFNKQSGRWERITEGKTDGGEMSQYVIGKGKDKSRCKHCGKVLSSAGGTCKCKEKTDENHDAAGFPTNAPGRPQYKVAGPQFRTADDVLARTRQYEPEITEMYDEEENTKMQERYSELATAQRNLSESELSELKDLGFKLDKRSVSEANVNMKMGKSYKVVQPRQLKTSEPDFFARRNQYDPEVSEYGAPVIEPDVQPDVEPETEPWKQPEREPAIPQEPEPQVPDPLQPDRPGIEPRPRGEGVMEAGGGAVQHSSGRTVQDRPQIVKNRHRGDIDESAKKKVNELANDKWTVLHDIAVHCKRRFPTIATEELKKVIPILFKKDTGWDANPEQVEAIVAQIESGEIKQ